MLRSAAAPNPGKSIDMPDSQLKSSPATPFGVARGFRVLPKLASDVDFGRGAYACLRSSTEFHLAAAIIMAALAERIRNV